MSNQKIYGPWIKWHGGSGYGAQVIEENGRFALTFWPYCTNCQSPFQFDAEEPFAYCSCGTTEWGDPRPASWVCPPRQPSTQHDVVVDALRRAAKSAAPYGTAMIVASHLNEAADTIDNLRSQLIEARRDSARLKNDAAIFYEAAAGLLTTNDALRTQLAEVQCELQSCKYGRAISVDDFIATFRCEDKGIVGKTDAKIHSVSQHDDGVIEVVIDYWP